MGRIRADLIKHQFHRHDFELDYSKFNSREEMINMAVKVAKANNQRLLRLERNNATKVPAYSGAMKALSGMYSETGKVEYGHIGKNGKPRYLENRKKIANLSDKQLKEMLYALSKTSTARTSTVGHVKKVYGAGLENIKGFLGLDDNDAEIDDFLALLETESYKTLAKEFGYKSVIQMINQLNELGLSPDEIGQKFEEVTEGWADQDKENKRRKEQGLDLIDIPERNLLNIRKDLGLEEYSLKENEWKTSV